MILLSIILALKNVIFDANEEKVVTFYKEMDLTAGNYYMILYYLDEMSGWTRFSPDSYNQINFTVAYPTGIEEVAAGKPSIYPNPATDVLYIKSSSVIKSVMILDISGKPILRQEPSTTRTVPVSVNNLSQGAYLIKIETEDGIYTEKNRQKVGRKKSKAAQSHRTNIQSAHKKISLFSIFLSRKKTGCSVLESIELFSGNAIQIFCASQE